jgi:hypothetical protein
MTLKAVDVFTPGSFPEYTYVQRADRGLEQDLRDSLDTTGQVVSISGPSKSGKTVLVEKVVGKENLITVTGASIREAPDLWDQVLDWMDFPSTTSSSRTIGGSVSVGAAAKGGLAVPFVAKGEVSTTGQASLDANSTTGATKERRGLQQVTREIANSSFVVLIDDFHYMPREVQMEVAKALKEAVRLGVKIVTAAVTHRGDDVVRANPELRGRVRSIDLAYWTPPELKAIASAGFTALNAQFESFTAEAFAKESAGSPQLMQLLCLESCFVANLRRRHEGMIPTVLNFDPELRFRVLEQTSSRTDYRSLVDVLDAGPPTRGTKRITFSFRDGTSGDVYRAVLKAAASDPPQLSFGYDELLARTALICSNDPPAGSSVTSTCVHMSKLAADKFPSERAIDWDDSKPVLDIPDPYLMFYLRWSGRLRIPQRSASVQAQRQLSESGQETILESLNPPGEDASE